MSPPTSLPSSTPPATPPGAPSAASPVSPAAPVVPNAPSLAAPAGLSGRLNWLRAAVLGANDGILSTAGLVLGVAGAHASFSALLTAGVAGLVAGALSMAAGEYVSVSTQRDTEKAAVHQEKAELAALPEAELRELAALLQRKGLHPTTAHQAALEMTQHDALAAHAELELGIQPGQYTNPWHAAGASAAAFAVGALVPLLAVLLSPTDQAVPLTAVAVVLALWATGMASAHLGGASRWRAAVRNVLGGVLAMGVTYAIGSLVGAQL